MSLWEIILWILAFAVVSMILYGWGLRKSMDQQRDLLAALYRKGEVTIRKVLKKNGSMTRKELEKSLAGMQASLFYSKNRVTVEDPHTFSAELLAAMTARGFLLQEDDCYRLNPADKRK